jgi:hypothetical protein
MYTISKRGHGFKLKQKGDIWIGNQIEYAPAMGGQNADQSVESHKFDLVGVLKLHTF